MAKKQYECDCCLSEHDSESDAEDCCETTCTIVYYCGKCEECFQDDEAGANECCEGAL
jgi:hypothetical protein